MQELRRLRGAHMHIQFSNFPLLLSYLSTRLLITHFQLKRKKKVKTNSQHSIAVIKISNFSFLPTARNFLEAKREREVKIIENIQTLLILPLDFCLALDGCWMEESSKLFQLIFISYIAQLDCAGFTTKFIALRVRACCDDQQINNVRMLRMSWKIWKNLLDHAVAEIKRILIAHRSLYYDELNKIQHHRHHLVISHKSLISDFFDSSQVFEIWNNAAELFLLVSAGW